MCLFCKDYFANIMLHNLQSLREDVEYEKKIQNHRMQSKPTEYELLLSAKSRKVSCPTLPLF